MEPTASNDKNQDRKDDKGEEEDKDEDGATISPLIGVIVLDNKSDSDNEKEEDVDQTLTKSMNMDRSFLSRRNGIFTESNGEDDYAGEESDNKLTKSNSNPTSRLTKETKYKRFSEKKSKPPHTIDLAIKYQNNKKKKRKKVKPTIFKPKTSTSDEDSTDSESNDMMPGLQNRNRADSDSEDENDNNPGATVAGTGKRPLIIMVEQKKYVCDANLPKQLLSDFE